MPTRIVLCNEYYDTNLGDGIAAAGFRYLASRAAPRIAVQHMDISGRTARAPQPRPLLNMPRSIHRALLHASVPYWRAASLLKWRLQRQTHAARWLPAIRGAHALVIGCGRLISDAFVLRIRDLVQLARAHDVPVAFHACGVDGKLSPWASRLFKEALSQDHVIAIGARDTLSRTRLAAIVPGFPVRLTPDPALWTAEAFGISSGKRSRTIGLGIIAPETLRSATGRLDHARLIRFWVALAHTLLAAGHRVALFTNGAPIDHAFAARIAHELRTENLASMLPRPRSPRELIAQLAGFKAIAASRLHALTPAFALGVPNVGLVWDDKVRQFCRETAAPCFDIVSANPEGIAAALTSAAAAGISRQRRARMKAAARTAAARLFKEAAS